MGSIHSIWMRAAVQDRCFPASSRWHSPWIPVSHGRVYCATYNRGLWRSEDAGETWLPAGTPQGFFDGPTDGAIEPRETTFVSVDPVAQADGHHAVWVGTEPSRLYRSTDHGDTFELASALDLPSRSRWSFPPRPRTHHVQCIAHTSDGRMHLAIEAGAMIRSRDSGRTFEDRLPDSPVDTHVLLTHPLAPRWLYAALGDALLRPGRSFAESPDGGDTWVYSGKGLEASPYLYGRCHSSRQSRGHSSRRIAEPAQSSRARRSVNLPSRSRYLGGRC